MSNKFSLIRSIVAVAGGKGGVGKSSISVLLARAMRERGYETGILDADLYGPSLGHMMPLDTPLQRISDGEGLIPGRSGGISVFSLSHVRPEGESMSVRAPVTNGLILQCVDRIDWGELDVLFVDFPPGTGDIPLTLVQSLPFSGAVLVSGPQEVSVIDVKKAGEMFCALGVPIAGVIENMSHFVDPVSGVKHFPFGEGGGGRLAEMFDCPLLGQVPLDPDIGRTSDRGENFLEMRSDSGAAAAVREIATVLRKILFASVSHEISGGL